MNGARRPAARAAGALVAMAVATAACAAAPARDAGAAEPGDVVVLLKGLTFAPVEVTVPVGQRVVWRWTDGVVHNVVADKGGFARSGEQGGGSYAVRFDGPGRFAYRCTLHIGMDGVVVATPS